MTTTYPVHYNRFGKRTCTTTRVYTFRATGADLWDRRSHTPADGTHVRKTQPHGCPRNGTMGMCYVEDAATGQFIGMVSESSLI